MLARTKLWAISPLALFAAIVPICALAQDEAARLDQIKAMFDPASIVAGPTVVDCTLSGGTETTCFSITVKSSVAQDEMGPWCPRNIADGPEAGGIWPRDGVVHDVDGAFVEKLSTFYDDPDWQMLDPATGAVNVTDSKESCEAAARPDVDEAYNNYCVECATSYMEAEPVMTYVIPLTPEDTWLSTRLNPVSGVGIAFNGIKFDAPAPQADILAAHTLAPFDDCGGHVNTHVGYHYHAVTGCTPEVATVVDHAPIIGIAMDGYPLTARLDADAAEPTDLDSCRGHETDGLGYHYHVNDPGSNQTIGCFKAEHGCSLADGTQVCDAANMRPTRP